MTIQVTRTEHSAAEPRHIARVASDPDQARRLLAIAQILEGSSRADAARNAGMERQTLRDWALRFNAEGVEGLKDCPRPGRKPLLDEGQLAKLDQIVDTQPDPVKDGVVRWRRRDLKVKIKSLFDVEISERPVGRIPRARKFRGLAPRPKHPKADEAQQLISAKILPPHYGNTCLGTPKQSLSKSGSRTRRALASKAR
jgi:transposase